MIGLEGLIRLAQLVGLVALILIGGATFRAVFGHEWYPLDCCSGHDCDALAEARVKRTAAGDYIVDGKWLFERSNKIETRPSLSGRYHACIPTEGARPKCFFAPPDEF